MEEKKLEKSKGDKITDEGVYQDVPLLGAGLGGRTKTSRSKF